MDDTSRDAELENYLDALTGKLRYLDYAKVYLNVIWYNINMVLIHFLFSDFVKKPSKSIPSVLEQLIQRIARHGEPL